MDRDIDSRTIRLRRARRVGVWTLSLAAGFGAVAIVMNLLRPTVNADEIRTALVVREPIEDTISASGTVVPEYEQVISSPVDSRIERILKSPGDRLEAGDSIIELDTGESRLQLGTFEDQIALKMNEREQARQDLDSRLSDLSGQLEIKELELRSAEYEAIRARRYYIEGLFSRDEMRRAVSDSARTVIELRQLRESAEHAGRALETQLQGLDLELNILQKERDEAQRRLQLATAAADRPGVLTWVMPAEGASVRRGDALARIADLSSYRVEATVSDVHARRIEPGQEVAVITGDTRLAGHVSAVRPLVENGVVTLDVDLDDSRHEVLRHNLRVEVYVITARAADALCVPRGQYPTVEGQSYVFVVRGDRAHRTRVDFGLQNYRNFQVLSGLAEDDRVITSDMRNHEHVEEVTIR